MPKFVCFIIGFIAGCVLTFGGVCAYGYYMLNIEDTQSTISVFANNRQAEVYSGMPISEVKTVLGEPDDSKMDMFMGDEHIFYYYDIKQESNYPLRKASLRLKFVNGKLQAIDKDTLL